MISLLEGFSAPKGTDTHALVTSGLLKLGAQRIQAAMSAFEHYVPYDIDRCFLGVACGSSNNALRSDELFGLTRLEAIVLMEMYDSWPEQLRGFCERFLESQREPHRVECAWCNTQLSPGREPTSHGICSACRVIYFGPEVIADEPAYV